MDTGSFFGKILSKLESQGTSEAEQGLAHYAGQMYDEAENSALKGITPYSDRPQNFVLGEGGPVKSGPLSPEGTVSDPGKALVPRGDMSPTAPGQNFELGEGSDVISPSRPTRDVTGSDNLPVVYDAGGNSVPPFEGEPNMSSAPKQSGSPLLDKLISAGRLAPGLMVGGALVSSMMGGNDPAEGELRTPPNVGPAQVPNSDNKSLPINIPPALAKRASGHVSSPAGDNPVAQKLKAVLDFGDGNNADSAAALQDAQDRQNKAVLANQLGKAGDLIGSSFARTAAHPDGFDANIKDAGTIVSQQQELAAKQKNDPNSPLSKGMKSFLTSMGFQVNGNPSASDMEKMTPLAEKYMQHQDDMANRQMLAKQHSEDLKYHYAQLAQIKANAASSKAQTASDKAYTDASVKALTPRGNSNVQAAMLGQTAVKKAKDLVALYPDLNEMPQTQVNMLTTELSKIAQGGIPTEGMQKELGSHTYLSDFKALMTKVKGSPTGADLAGFINEHMKYLDSLENVNNGVVNKYHRDVYNAYKNRFTPDDQDRFKSEHADAFMDEGNAAPKGNNQAPAAPAAAPTKHPALLRTQLDPAAPHPDDPRALKELESMPESPKKQQLREILKQKGILKSQGTI